MAGYRLVAKAITGEASTDKFSDLEEARRIAKAIVANGFHFKQQDGVEVSLPCHMVSRVEIHTVEDGE